MSEQKLRAAAVGRCESCGYEFLISDDPEWCNECRRAGAASDSGATSTAPKTAFAAAHGSATPSRRTDYCLHGFSFESSEERQGAAAGNHLWPAFVAWMVNRGYTEWPDMDDRHYRELFECFVEGGWQEASQNDQALRRGEETPR